MVGEKFEDLSIAEMTRVQGSGEIVITEPISVTVLPLSTILWPPISWKF
ncbi:lichenicidin A2 family type 2 lantibiotic [Paenibacillus sp. IHBB 10380]